MQDQDGQPNFIGERGETGKCRVIRFVKLVRAHRLSHPGEHIDYDQDRLAALLLDIDMPCTDIIKPAFVKAAPFCLERKPFGPCRAEAEQFSRASLEPAFAIFKREVQHITLRRLYGAEREAVGSAGDAEVIDEPALAELRLRAE